MDDDEEQKPQPHQVARRYQFRNLKDLHFDSFNESPEHDVEQPSVLPYFVQNGRFRATAVLEESVIDTECIKQSAFLRQFDPEFVEEMLSCEGCVRAIVFLPKQVIVREGEQGDSMMVIAKGEVEVSVHGVPVKRLGEGSFFGELVFVGATDVRTATITAVTFCDVRLIYRRAFTEVISKYPLVQQAFNDLVSQRIEAVQKDLLKHLRLAVKRASQVGSGRSPRTMATLRQSVNANSSRALTAPTRPSGQTSVTSMTNALPSGGPQRGQQLALPPPPGSHSVDTMSSVTRMQYNSKAVEDPPWKQRVSGLSSVGQAVLKR